MPSKKKKFNSRFPPARIKKIMQTDEEVGKVAAAVPVIISRALELFVESLLTKAVQITSSRNAKTLSPAHLKQCILAESRFDFLKDLVMAVPDVQGEGEEGGSGTVSVPSTPTGLIHHQQNPPVFIRSHSEVSSLTGTTAGSSSSTASRRLVGGTGRPRGRPRKNPAVSFHNSVASSRSRPTSSRKSGATDSENEEESTESDDEDYEENSSDENSSGKGTLVDNRKTKQNGAGAVMTHSLNTPSVQFNAVQPNFYQEIGQNSGTVPPTGTPQPSAASFQIQIHLPGNNSNNGTGLAGGNSNEDDDYDT